MNNNKHTFVQYFFWLFAGSEIHILKSCETDYNRHARMGFIIFMVTIIASCAGGLAGYTFSGGHWELVDGSYRFIGGSMLVAIAAGIIWGLLIFGIDSNMVTTIKKDPDAPLQKWGSLFWSRAIIGLFIAAFISIPLEILIFHEDVLIQMEKDKANQIIEMKNKQISIYDIKSLEKTQLKKELVKREQDSVASLGCKNCAPYQTAKSEVTNCEVEQKNKKARYERLSGEVETMRRSGNLGGNFFQKKRYLESAKSDYYSQRKVCGELNKIAISICEKYTDSIQREKHIADSAVKVVTTRIDNNNSIVDSVTDAHLKQLSGLKGFTRQFIALEHASHEDLWLFVLLWLVRFIFIGLEILPTYTKLSTPIGDYDNAIKSREQAFKNRLDSDRQINEYTEFIRIVTESKRNESAIQNMAKAENDIAQQMIDEWKRQEEQDINKKISNYRSV